MSGRVIYRLRDILDSIEQIETLLSGKKFETMFTDRVLRAAFERFVEVLSEASRHVSDDLKQTAPEIEWARIADIGNHLRHAYHRTDAEILWRLYSDGHLKS